MEAGLSDPVAEAKIWQEEHVGSVDDGLTAMSKAMGSDELAAGEAVHMGSSNGTNGAAKVVPLSGVPEGQVDTPTEQQLEVDTPLMGGSAHVKDVVNCEENASEAYEAANKVAEALPAQDCEISVETEHDQSAEGRSNIVSEARSLDTVQDTRDGAKTMVASKMSATAFAKMSLGLSRVDSDKASAVTAGSLPESSRSNSGSDISLPDAVHLCGHHESPNQGLQTTNDGSSSTLPVQSSLPETCIVHVDCSVTSIGDVVALLGSDETLGSWDVAKAIVLSTGPTTFPVWSVDIPMPAPESEFKFIIKKHTGGATGETLAQNRKWTFNSAVLNAEFGRSP